MKIAFPLYSLENTGGSRIIVALANHLARQGYNLSLIIPVGANRCYFPIDEAVSIVEVKAATKTSQTLALVNAIPKGSLVIATMYQTAYIALAARLMRRCQDIVYLVQHYEPYIFGRFSQRSWLRRTISSNLARFSYHLPARKVCVSKWLKDLMPPSHREKSTIINPGVDLSVFKPLSMLKPKGVITIGTIGRQASYKGTKTVVDACRLLDTVRKKINLKIASFERLNIDIPLPHQLFMPISDDELVRFYNSLHLFVSASVSEGFGLPPLEAMACGVPCVMVDNPGSREYAHHFNNLLLVKDDARAICSAIQNILDDKELEQKLIQGGLETAKRLTLEHFCHRFETEVLSRI